MTEAKKDEKAVAAQPATKPEEKKETWLNWLAITTILFSAAATLATFRGGGLSTKAVLSQSHASDNWSYFQAKSVKQHTYEMQRDMFKIQVLEATDKTRDAYQERIAKYDKNVLRYEKEKKSIALQAVTLEAERQRCQDIGAFFGLAVPYLQVGIMLSALAALMKKKPIWMVGCIPGALGLAYFLVGYGLFVVSDPLVNFLTIKP